MIGGPFSVIESDPGIILAGFSWSKILNAKYSFSSGVFTSLLHNLGISGLEASEIYDIDWGLSSLHPKGLIFCFNWRPDTHHVSDFQDPAADAIWFANQLEDDACASLAVLNVLFNLDISRGRLGEEMEDFRRDTAEMSPKVRIVF